MTTFKGWVSNKKKPKSPEKKIVEKEKAKL